MHLGTCPGGHGRAVPTCMKLITSRALGTALSGIVLAVAMEGQQAIQSTESHFDKNAPAVTALLSTSPLEGAISNTGAATESALAVPNAAILPLTPQPVLRPKAIHSEGGPSQRELRIWKSLLIAEHSAAAFDAWSTRRSIESGNGFERNVLVRPFANSAAIYPALQIAPLGFDYLSHRMMRSQNRLFRKTWWLPQAASTAASLWCGSRNLRVANLKR